MSRYRIACSCGLSVPVTEAQAGSTFACACGKTIVVPILRELRKLPRDEAAPAASVAASPGSAKRWDARKAVLFVAALCTVGCLVLAAVLGIGRARMQSGWSPELQKFVDDAFVDSIDYTATLGAWEEMKKTGLGEAAPTTLMLNSATHEQLGGYIVWSLVGAAAGAVVWIGAVRAGRR